MTPLTKYTKDETPTNQNNVTSGLQNGATPRHQKNITKFVPREDLDPAARINIESPTQESKIPRYVKKYPLVTSKDKPTLTSDSSKPKNETTTRSNLRERREERQNITDNKRENYPRRSKRHQQAQWKHWPKTVKTKAKNLL